MISEQVKQELENLRKKYCSLKRWQTVFKWGVLVLVIAFILSMLLFFVDPFIFIIFTVCIWGLLFVCGIVSFILKFTVDAALRQFRELYKTEFVRGVLEEILDCVEEYNGTDGLATEELRNYRLIRIMGIPHTEDYLRARYGEITFEQSNVKIVRYVNKREVTSFSGYVLKLPYPKQISSVHIFSNSFTVGDSGKNFQVMFYGAGNVAPVANYAPGQIDTEDIDFNDKFDVWAEQEQDAFYLLTPHFMELLKRLLYRYPSIGFHFRGNEVYIAIETTRDTFDCDMNEPVDYILEKEMIKGDINQIKGIIDVLKLQKNVQYG